MMMYNSFIVSSTLNSEYPLVKSVLLLDSGVNSHIRLPPAALFSPFLVKLNYNTFSRFIGTRCSASQV